MSKNMKLKEAYRTLIASAKPDDVRESHQRLSNIKANLRNGKRPTEATMRKHLKAAGWELSTDETWTKP